MTVSPGARTDVDADLVEALRREDPDAAEQVVERFGDRVYRLAQRITGVKEDAEEAAQDALWTAARKIGTFKGESAFGSWLYRIAANAAYQKLRARRGKAREVALDDVLPRSTATAATSSRWPTGRSAWTSARSPASCARCSSARSAGCRRTTARRW